MVGLAFVAAALCCRVATAPAAPPAAVMLGEWSHRNAVADSGAPSLGAGLLVTSVVDSVDSTWFRGHVGRWFSGDVGVSPAVFGPVTGSVTERGSVTIVIAYAAPDTPALTIWGSVAADVVTVRESSAGTQPGPFRAGDHFERSPHTGT